MMDIGMNPLLLWSAVTSHS